MNDNRRVRLNEIIDQIDTLKNDLEDVLSEERDAYEKLSENFQLSEKGEKMEAAISNMESASSNLDKAISEIKKAKEETKKKSKK